MIPYLPPEPVQFPATHLALNEPNGLLAAGGDLTPAWLLEAYSRGIFPWFGEGEPILWWTPDPRCVLYVDKVKRHRSLRKTMKKPQWQVKFDTCFKTVMQACGETPRPKQEGTWITPEILNAYTQLHALGYAHSVELFWNGELVGGLYGVQIGKMFYGESMFSWKSDASKIALVTLCDQLKQWGFELIDCQVENEHLLHMGAENIPRTDFEATLFRLTRAPFAPQKWTNLAQIT